MVTLKENSELTKEEILARVSEKDIFDHYLGYYAEPNKMYISPFRRERRPSFNIFRNNNGGLRFKDFGNGYHGDFIEFVSLLHHTSYINTLKLINRDLKLGIGENDGRELKLIKASKIEEKVPLKGKDDVFILYTERNMMKYDIDYWQQFGITLDTLLKFNVLACKEAFVYRNGILTLSLMNSINNPIYCYKQAESVKIYRPMMENYRFISTCTGEIMQGFEQLPDKGELLIITKSMKDVMSLYELGYSSIAPQAESVILPKELIDSLYNRFDNIILFYDCDRAGYIYSERLSNTLGLPRIFLQNNYCILQKNDDEPKDISSYIKLYGKEKGKQLIDTIINGGSSNRDTTI